MEIGERFDPLAGVTAQDAEDGEITLTEENIIDNDVDTSKAGTYHVTYRVTDQNGASTEKTITVTIKEKTVDQPESPQTHTAETPKQPLPPKTGDLTQIEETLFILLGTVGIFVALVWKKRKRNEH